MNFEWDLEKARSNRAKHGISFEDATQVWFDPNLVLFPDLYSQEEERWIAIGVVGAITVLQVVHVYRGEDEQTARIISARRASAYEKLQYAKANT